MSTDFKLNKILIFSLSLIMALVLSGCIQMQVHLTLYEDDQWAGVQAVHLSQEAIQMMDEMEQMATDDPDLEVSSGLPGTEYETLEQKYADDDNVTVKTYQETDADGSLYGTLQANGQGNEALNELLFGGDAQISTEIVNGQKHVTIRVVPEGDVQEVEGGDEMMESLGIKALFRISGAEIISSNADRVEGGTAIWEDTSVIEVTLIPATELDQNTIAVDDTFFTPFESLDDNSSSGEFEGETSVTLSESDFDSSTSDTTTDNTTSNKTTAETTTETNTDSADLLVSNEPGQENETPANTETDTSTASPSTEQPAAPVAEDQNLPQSGGILALPVSNLPFVMAGLTMLALAIGAVKGLLIRR